ncbi:MAG: hypothetical protein NTZ59_02115, partial [Bacteroidetes bacterium]|nr:hypothetical protein [Bacteroidota bacterium]
MKKNSLKIVLSVCLVFVLKTTNAQQGTGSFVTMDGGLEGQTVGQLPNTTSSSLPTSNWTRSSATGSVTIRAISSGTARTGNNFVSINNTSTTGSTNLLSPFATSGAIVGGASYIIQFYYRATDLTTLPNANVTVGVSNASGTAVTNTAYTPNATTNNAFWLKSVNVVTASNGAVPSNGFSNFRIASNAATNGKGIDIDDWVVYAGNNVDNIAPSDPGSVSINNPTGSTLDVSWAASSNIDSGGYLVVRYAFDPNTLPQTNPNTNGIYAVGNALGAGVVAFTGTATSFTDNLLNVSTQYWYRVFTVDKAFNYSNYSQSTGSTNTSVAVVRYFIDATNGNDLNDGKSESTAWKSIAKVNATTFVAGDSILFKCGEVWTGTTLAPKGSGSSSKRIVV